MARRLTQAARIAGVLTIVPRVAAVRARAVTSG